MPNVIPMEKPLTWREKCVCRILLILARIVGGEELDFRRREDLDALSNHITHGERVDRS